MSSLGSLPSNETKLQIYVFCKEGRGNLELYNPSPQSFKITFSYSLYQQLRGIYNDFDWLVTEDG